MKQADSDANSAAKVVGATTDTPIFPIRGSGLFVSAGAGTKAMETLTAKIAQIAAVAMLIEESVHHDSVISGAVGAIHAMADESRALADAVWSQLRARSEEACS